MICIRMPLRVAEKKDFFNFNDEPMYGRIYFLINSRGIFDKQPYYLEEHTDKESFKEYFKNKQVYVPVRLFDEVEIIGTID